MGANNPQGSYTVSKKARKSMKKEREWAAIGRMLSHYQDKPAQKGGGGGGGFWGDTPSPYGANPSLRTGTSNLEVQNLQHSLDNSRRAIAMEGKNVPEANPPSFLNRVIDVISRPVYGVANSMQELNERSGLTDEDESNDRQWIGARDTVKALASGFKSGITGKEKTYVSDVLQGTKSGRENLEIGARIAEKALNWGPEINNPLTAAFDKDVDFIERGKDDDYEKVTPQTLAAVGGFVGDVALDPLSWVGLGFTKRASQAAIARSGNKAAKAAAATMHTDDAVKQATKDRVKRFMETDTYKKLSDKKKPAAIEKEKLAAQEEFVVKAYKAGEEAARGKKGTINLNIAGKTFKSEKAYNVAAKALAPVRENPVVDALGGIFNTSHRVGRDLTLSSRIHAGRGVVALDSQIKDWEKVHKGLSKADAVRISHAMEDGIVLEGKLGEVQAAARKILDEMYELENAPSGILGPVATYKKLENYVPHYYTRKAKSKDYQAFKEVRKGKTLGKDKAGYEFAREIPSLEEAKSFKLKPKEDIREIIGDRIAEHHRSFARHGFLQEAIEKYAMIVPSTKTVKQAARKAVKDTRPGGTLDETAADALDDLSHKLPDELPEKEGAEAIAEVTNETVKNQYKRTRHRKNDWEDVPDAPVVKEGTTLRRPVRSKDGEWIVRPVRSTPTHPIYRIKRDAKGKPVGEKELIEKPIQHEYMWEAVDTKTQQAVQFSGLEDAKRYADTPGLWEEFHRPGYMEAGGVPGMPTTGLDYTAPIPDKPASVGRTKTSKVAANPEKIRKLRGQIERAERAAAKMDELGDAKQAARFRSAAAKWDSQLDEMGVPRKDTSAPVERAHKQGYEGTGIPWDPTPKAPARMGKPAPKPSNQKGTMAEIADDEARQAVAKQIDEIDEEIAVWEKKTSQNKTAVLKKLYDKRAELEMGTSPIKATMGDMPKGMADALEAPKMKKIGAGQYELGNIRIVKNPELSGPNKWVAYNMDDKFDVIDPVKTLAEARMHAERMWRESITGGKAAAYDAANKAAGFNLGLGGAKIDELVAKHTGKTVDEAIPAAKTIEKSGEQLKPGDVIIGKDGKRNVIKDIKIGDEKIHFRYEKGPFRYAGVNKKYNVEVAETAATKAKAKKLAPPKKGETSAPKKPAPVEDEALSPYPTKKSLDGVANRNFKSAEEQKVLTAKEALAETNRRIGSGADNPEALMARLDYLLKELSQPDDVIIAGVKAYREAEFRLIKDRLEELSHTGKSTTAPVDELDEMDELHSIDDMPPEDYSPGKIPEDDLVDAPTGTSPDAEDGVPVTSHEAAEAADDAAESVALADDETLFKEVPTSKAEQKARAATIKKLKLEKFDDQEILDAYPHLKDAYVPKEIKNALQGINKLYKTDEDLQRMLTMFDRNLHRWKTLATVVNPGHHSRNFVGDMYLNWLDDVQWKAYDKAYKIKIALRRDNPTAKFKFGKTEFTARQLQHAYEKAGLKSGYYRAELGPTAKGMKYIRAGAEIREDYARFTHFVDGVEKAAKEGKWDKLSPAERIVKLHDAAHYDIGERIRKFNFDYGDLTEIERRMIRRWMPFYTFMRKNIPLQLSMIAMRPGKIARIPKGIHAIEEMLGTNEEYGRVNEQIPQWLRDLTAVGVQISGGENPSFLSGALPLQDVGRLEGVGSLVGIGEGGPDLLGGMGEIGKELIGSTRPEAKALLERTYGRSTFTGQDLKNEDGFEYGANQIPAARVVRKQFFDDNATPQDKQDSLFNWLTGMGKQTVTDQRKMSELRRQQDPLKSIMADINRKRREKIFGPGS